MGSNLQAGGHTSFYTSAESRTMGVIRFLLSGKNVFLPVGLCAFRFCPKSVSPWSATPVWLRFVWKIYLYNDCRYILLSACFVVFFNENNKIFGKTIFIVTFLLLLSSTKILANLLIISNVANYHFPPQSLLLVFCRHVGFAQSISLFSLKNVSKVIYLFLYCFFRNVTLDI